jgi:hypothetical protein
MIVLNAYTVRFCVVVFYFTGRQSVYAFYPVHLKGSDLTPKNWT